MIPLMISVVLNNQLSTSSWLLRVHETLRWRVACQCTKFYFAPSHCCGRDIFHFILLQMYATEWSFLASDIFCRLLIFFLVLSIYVWLIKFSKKHYIYHSKARFTIFHTGILLHFNILAFGTWSISLMVDYRKWRI